MFLTHLSQLTSLLMVTVSAWAILRGRWPERATAVAYTIDWIGAAIWEDRRPHHHSQPVMAALDLALLMILLLLTVSCRRQWLLWMSACSLLVVLTHVAALFDASFGQWSYLTAYYVWSLGALLAFGIGVVTEGHRPVVSLVALPWGQARPV